MRSGVARMARSAVASLVVGAALVGPIGPSSAQAAPTLTVSPPTPGRGDPVTVTVDGCTPEAGLVELTIFVIAQDNDAVTPLGLADQGGATWSITLGGLALDQTVIGTGCTEGEPAGLPLTIDVDAPRLIARPLGSDVVSSVELTDCADAAGPSTIDVGVAADAPYDEAGIVIGDPDAQGDVIARFTEPLPPGEVTVTARCGDTDYDAVTYVVAGEPTSTTSTSTTSTSTTSTIVPVVPPAVAPAATPVATAARFTG